MNGNENNNNNNNNNNNRCRTRDDLEEGDGDDYLLSLSDVAPEGYHPRRFRRRTNWMYRHESSNVRLARYAVELLDLVVAWSVASMSLTFVSMGFFMDRSIEVGRNLGYAMFLMAQTMHYMALCCYLDLQDILFVADHGTYGYGPPTLSSINQIPDGPSSEGNDANALTGFLKDELRLLLIHWRIPETFVPTAIEKISPFSGEMAMIFFLSWMKHGWL